MTETVTIGEALAKFLRSRGFEKRIKQEDIIRRWPEIVGNKIADKTKPKRITNNILVVKVDDAVWRNEMVYYREEIRKKINSIAGEELVKELKFE